MTTIRQGGIAISVALGLLSMAACGARWSDEERAAVHARHAVAPGSAAGPAAVAGSDASSGTSLGPSASTVPGASQTDGNPAAPGGGDSAPRPCAAPSSAPGVTESDITVGSISSLSGPVPGLGVSGAAAVRAYIAYRNSTGGVCGRRIVLKEGDDGSSGAQYRSIISGMEPKVLGIAGGFTIGDIAATDIISEKQIPLVNSPSGQAVSDLPTVFDLVPAYDDPHEVIGKYRFLYDHGAHEVALAYLAVAQSRFEANLQRSLMEAAGMKVVLQQELPLTTLSYDAAARSVANSGADYLFFISDIHGEAAMAKAMAGTGYRLKFSEYYNFAYGTPFLEQAGSSADGTLAWLRSLPNEEAASNPEMKAFVEWMGRVAPGADLDQIASDGWAEGKAFFDVLESIPGPITRPAFVGQLRATETFDAGGMYGPIRLGAERTNACFVGMQAQGGRWTRLAPESGFLCK